MFTSTDVGKRLSVHANTIRTWSDRYKAHLSAGAVSGNRLFTDADLRVLATIAHYRQLGISLDEVAGILADGKLIDELPPESNPADEAARSAVQLVPRDQLFRALDEVKRLDDERLRLMIERDSALGDKEALNDKIATLMGEMGELRGKLAERPPESDKQALNEKIAELEREIGVLQGTLKDRRPSTFWLTVLAAAIGLAVVATAILLLAGRGIGN